MPSFAFAAICQAAGQLREQFDDAYNLMCTAPWLDGLRVNAGDDLEVVREQVDLRHAEIGDVEIAPMQPELDPDALTWTIEFDLPPKRWPWARGGPKADLSGEGLMVEDLLDRARPGV